MRERIKNGRRSNTERALTEDCLCPWNGEKVSILTAESARWHAGIERLMNNGTRTRVSQVQSQNHNGCYASVVDVAAHSSSDELSSPRRIELVHFGCVEDNLCSN